VASLVDTNVLVYRFDRRFPDKQATATDLLCAGVAEGTLYLPHQAIVEFVAVTSRPLRDRACYSNRPSPPVQPDPGAALSGGRPAQRVHFRPRSIRGQPDHRVGALLGAAK
jgi:hypothetical protein